MSSCSNTSSWVVPITMAAAALAGVSLLAATLLEQRRKRLDNTTTTTPTSNQTPAPRRFGGAIRLKPEQYRRYRELHDNVWPEILDRMHQSNIRNFTIYYHQETSTLFSHFEWIGHWTRWPLTPKQERALFEQDMQAIAKDAMTQTWWKECEPCQTPFSQWDTTQPPPSQGGKGDWWAPLECVTHCGYWPVVFGDQDRDPDFVKMT